MKNILKKCEVLASTTRPHPSGTRTTVVNHTIFSASSIKYAGVDGYKWLKHSILDDY